MIYNKTNHKLVAAIKVELLDTEKKRKQGLMFKRRFNKALFFYYDKKEYLLIHMFFVFHKIDIVYLDKDLRFIKIKKNILPFTPLIFPPKLARHFIELPSGIWGEKLTNQRDYIQII